MLNIHEAIEEQDHLSISLLLPEYVTWKGWKKKTILMELCQYGLYQHIEHAIKCGYNSKDITDDGYTSLHYAILSGCSHTVKTILKQNMNINARNIDGDTPAMLAVVNNNLDLLEILVEEGANIQLFNVYEQSILYACDGTTSPQIISYLLDILKINIDHQDVDGYSALMYANLIEDEVMVQRLLDHGASTSLRDNNGRTFHDYR